LFGSRRLGSTAYRSSVGFKRNSANLPEETRKELLQHGFDFTLSPIVEKTARRRFLDAFAEEDKDGVSFYFEILKTFLPSDKIGSLMKEAKEKKKEKESKAVSE
jgi:hypothetical protein